MRWTMAIPSVCAGDSVVIVLLRNPRLIAPDPLACWQSALFPAPFLTVWEAGWHLALLTYLLPLTPPSTLVGLDITEAQ